MTLLRQLLLIPLLAPLLAVLLVGAINPRPAISLRLLVWSSPALPVGAWMALAAAGGGLLSALGTGLALAGSAPGLQRQVRRPIGSPWQRAGAEPEARQEPSPTAAAAGPSRAAGEPSPTVAVPYRIIRRARPAAAHQTSANAAAPPEADGWDEAGNDDW